jgi:hypothetical protein
MKRMASARLRWLGLLCLTAALPPVGGCDAQGGGLSLRPTDTSDEIWAVRCLALQGPNRFQMAKKYADALRQVSGLKPDLVRIFHETDESVVYYGRYQRSYDARSQTESFRPDHLRDLELIRKLSLTIPDPAAGSRIVWPFRLATMSTLPIGGSTYPEWELTNAPGYYSLQVAVFYNTGQMRRRKYTAEQYCKLLRDQGEEAYYHHGTVNSSVCIGSFPKEAIQTFQEQDPLTGIIRVRAKMVDERLLALQRKFPFNLHNGHKFYEKLRDPQTGRTYRDPHASFAVEIPRAEPGSASFGR